MENFTKYEIDNINYYKCINCDFYTKFLSSIKKEENAPFTNYMTVATPAHTLQNNGSKRAPPTEHLPQPLSHDADGRATCCHVSKLLIPSLQPTCIYCYSRLTDLMTLCNR